jgi:hypothetical protein
MAFYFENTEHFPFLRRKFQKNKLCISFLLYFLRVFLDSENLVSKYEQLLISSHVGASTLVKLHLPVFPLQIRFLGSPLFMHVLGTMQAESMWISILNTKYLY